MTDNFMKISKNPTEKKPVTDMFPCQMVMPITNYKY